MDASRAKRYLLIAFGITWALWWGDAALVALTPLACTDALPYVLFTLGGFWPTISGCLCLEGGFSWKHLGKALAGRPGRSGWLWSLAILASTVVLFSLSSTGFVPSIASAPIAPLAIATVQFLVSATIYGGNEEIGWRGTLQPALEQGMSPYSATVIVALVWSCWHIPLWFIPGDSHQTAPFLGFLFIGVLLSFWLAAIWHASRSVALCMVMHGLVNTLMGVLAFEVGPTFLVGAAVLTALAVVCIRETQEHEPSA